MNTASASPERQVIAARVAIGLVFSVNGFAFASWVPHIPTVQARLGISAGQLGLALFGVAAGALVSMPIAGALTARFGSRRVTVISSVLFCLFVALPVRSTHFAMLAIALALTGAASGAMDVSMNAHGIVVEKRRGRPIMSSLHALYSLGGLLGAGSATLVLRAGIAPEAHLVAAAGLGLVVVLGAARFLLPGPEPHAGRGHAFALPSGPLVIFGWIAFFVMMAEGAMADWSAVYLRHTLAAAPGLAGAGFASFSLAMAAGRMTGDRLVAGLGPVAVVRGGGALAAVGLGAALLLHQPLGAVIGFGCVGLGLSNLIPIVFSTAGRTPGAVPGTAIAAVSTLGYGGFLAGPPLVGAVADLAGLPLALGLLVIFLALVSASAPLVRPRAPA